MIRVGIVGAVGFGGRELVRLLSAHPAAELLMATELEPGQPLAEVLPAFGKMTKVVLEPFDAVSIAERCDVVFVAVPGTKSMGLVSELRRARARVIDIGPDFRLKNAEVFAQYYGVPHTASELLPSAVYGLPAFYRDAIRHAGLVAVPGCYPISVIVPLRPLVDHISISGVSGAGRGLHESFHFPEMNENVRAYKVAVHQHTPEIEQELGNQVTVQFTPHVGPYTRGILTTIVLRPQTRVQPAICYERYRDEPFIRVLGEGRLPEIRYVRGSNFCDFGWVVDKRTGNLILVCAIDNLTGGTAGMAVQCMNLMFGLDEAEGLRLGGMAP